MRVIETVAPGSKPIGVLGVTDKIENPAVEIEIEVISSVLYEVLYRLRVSEYWLLFSTVAGSVSVLDGPSQPFEAPLA